MKILVPIEFKVDEHGRPISVVTKDILAAAQAAKQAKPALGDIFSGIAQGVGQKLFSSLTQLPSMLTGALHASMQAQAQQEAATNQLNLALANQGRLTAETSRALQDYASQMQATTTFGDEAVLAAEAMLASFGMTQKQIEATTKTAADFAAATGSDLQSAADLLGKAFAGNTAALSRYGIVIDENIPKGEKFNAVMEQLDQRFGGSAQAQAATYTGQMEQLKNAFGDLQESIGFAVGALLDTGRGTAAAKGALQGLTDFIKGDLVTAISELKAQWNEVFAAINASAANTTAKQIQELEKLRDQGLTVRNVLAGQGGASNANMALVEEADKLGLSLDDIINKLKGKQAAQSKAAQTDLDAADNLRGTADAAQAAGGNLLTFANAQNVVRPAVAATNKELEAQEKRIKAISDRFGAGLEAKQQQQVDELMSGALRRIGTITEPQVAQLKSELQGLGAVGQQAAADFTAQWSGLFDQIPVGARQFNELLKDSVSITDEITVNTLNARAEQEKQNKTLLAANQLWQAGVITTQEYDAIVGRVASQTEKVTKASFDWEHALQGVALLAGALRGKFGDVVNVVGNIAKAFDEAKTSADKFNAIASGVGQIGGIVGGRGGRAIQGAAGGAMAGFSVGGPVGAAIGGALGLFGSLFGGGDAKKKAEELKQKQDEAIKSFTSLFDEWKQARVELAGKAASALNSLITGFVDRLDEVMRSVTKTVVDEAGKTIEKTVKVGTGKFVPGLSSAANAAEYVAATFNLLRASGMTASQALDAIRPALEAMRKKLDAFKGTKAEDLLKVFDIIDKNKAVLDFIDGLGVMANALAGFGMLTQDLATRISGDLGGAIDQLTGQFAQNMPAEQAYLQALALNAQALYNLQQAAQKSGVSLDEHTQKMIDDAQNAGLFEGLEDPMKKSIELQGAMVTAMGELVKLMGGQLPAAVQKLIDEFNKAQVNPPSGAGAGAGAGGGAEGGPAGPGYKDGGPDRVSAAGGLSGSGPLSPRYLHRDTLIQAHAGEHALIIPKGHPVDVVSAAAGFGSIGKGGDGRDRDRPGGGGGGGGNFPGPTPPPTPVPTPGGGGGATSGEVHETRRAVAKVSAALEELARRPAAAIVGPTIQVQVDPIAIKEREDKLLARVEEHVADGVRTGNSAIIREMRRKGYLQT